MTQYSNPQLSKPSNVRGHLGWCLVSIEICSISGPVTVRVRIPIVPVFSLSVSCSAMPSYLNIGHCDY